MRITKTDLKEMILEVLSETNGEPGDRKATSREKRVGAVMESGPKMSAEEYENTLKQVLLSHNVNTVNRKAALEAIFGEMGTRMNTLIDELITQPTQGEDK